MGGKELGPGTRIDRYEIVRGVATGGMGQVWLARFVGKHGFEKQVAVKTILPELAADARFSRMFLDEARICARLAHANLAQILDVGEHEGLPYIVFEWVEGSSLEQLCRAAEARGVPVARGPLLRVMADVCAGLHAAHELADDQGRPLGVIHRDVTPNNIIVGRTGFAKLIDFGVAKAQGRIAGETRSGIVKGTPQYMAPEQARGDAIDRRCDVWAVGAVLYRALAGRPPFADRVELEGFILGRFELAPLPDDVPAGVREVVEHAMRRDRTDRYFGVDELRYALERALSGVDARRSVADLFTFDPDAPAPPPPPPGEPTAAEALPFARTSNAPLPLAPPAPPAPAEAPGRSGAKRDVRFASRSLKLALVVAVLLALAAVGALAIVAWRA